MKRLGFGWLAFFVVMGVGVNCPDHEKIKRSAELKQEIRIRKMKKAQWPCRAPRGWKGSVLGNGSRSIQAEDQNGPRLYMQEADGKMTATVWRCFEDMAADYQYAAKHGHSYLGR